MGRGVRCPLPALTSHFRERRAQAAAEQPVMHVTGQRQWPSHWLKQLHGRGVATGLLDDGETRVWQQGHSYAGNASDLLVPSIGASDFRVGVSCSSK